MPKKLISVLFFFAVFFGALIGANAGGVLFQYSTIDALLAGMYEGHLTMAELKNHGNLGLGTFNGLDGEMVVLDGKVYQVKADGIACLAADPVKTPFATVTFFSPKQLFPMQKVGSWNDLTTLLDKALPTHNIFYALKIEGLFDQVVTRSVPRQKRPYPPLAKVVEHQRVFRFKCVEGIIIGFRCPQFVKGINVPGYHLHFLTKDRTAGGHVLDCAFKNLTVRIDAMHRLLLVLPEDREFYRLNLTRDKTKELHRVER